MGQWEGVVSDLIYTPTRHWLRNEEIKVPLLDDYFQTPFTPSNQVSSVPRQLEQQFLFMSEILVITRRIFLLNVNHPASSHASMLKTV